MIDPAISLESVLHKIAAVAPAPWFPDEYAWDAGIAPDGLDEVVDKLLRVGLIHAAKQSQSEEIGYVLTYRGIQALNNPHVLIQLRDGRLASPPPTSPEIERVEPALRERAQAVRQALTGPYAPWVTRALLLANIAVFLAGLLLAARENIDAREYFALNLNPTRRVMRIQHQTGAITGADVLHKNEWWRLLSCCFVHVGLLHLAVNMYSLYAVGPLLERMWGHGRFLILYLIAGLGGSCAGVLHPLLSDGKMVQLAGASGALWGIMASMATWLILNRHVLPLAVLANWGLRLLVVAALNVGLTYMIPEISKGAHFGGGLVGLLVAVPLHYQRYGHGWQRWLAAGCVVAIPLLCVASLSPEVRARLKKPDAAGKEEPEPAKEPGEGDKDKDRTARQKEIHQANENYQHKAEAVEKESEEVYVEQVKPILELHPTRRNKNDPGAVDKARKALTGEAGRLHETAILLTRSGPHQARELEKARLAGTEYFKAKARFFELAEEYLGAGKRDSDGDLVPREKQVEQLRKNWQDLVKRSRQP